MASGLALLVAALGAPSCDVTAPGKPHPRGLPPAEMASLLTSVRGLEEPSLEGSTYLLDPS